jgi:hypothetical protein
MRRVECLTGWGGGVTYFEVEGDLGSIGPEDGGPEGYVEIPIVIVRLHAACSPEEAEMEAAPSRIGMNVLWLEPTCAMSLEQAKALRDALDAATEGSD